MKKLSILFVLLWAGSASANFTGTWAGSGKLAYSGGTTIACDPTSIGINQSETLLSVGAYAITCGDTTDIHMSANSVELRGDEIWYDNVRVGTITPDSLLIEMCEGDVCVKWDVRKTSETALKYIQTFTDHEGSVAIDYDLIRQ